MFVLECVTVRYVIILEQARLVYASEVHILMITCEFVSSLFLLELCTVMKLIPCRICSWSSGNARFLLGGR